MDLSKINESNISLASVTTKDGQRAKQIFCTGWPAAKATIQAIIVLVKNPIVKVIIGAVIACGDALEKKICN